MKKIFENPMLEIILLAEADVIATSDINLGLGDKKDEVDPDISFPGFGGF